MPMKSKRALRRHHLNRIKQLAFDQAKASFPSQRALWVPQMICRYRNRSPCSCWMCGNPRRYACRIAEQITRQEHIAALRETEQIQEAIGRPVYVARSAGGDVPVLFVAGEAEVDDPLAVDLDAMMKRQMELGGHWMHAVEKHIGEGFHRATGIAYYSPFFIEPDGNHRGY